MGVSIVAANKVMAPVPVQTAPTSQPTSTFQASYQQELLSTDLSAFIQGFNGTFRAPDHGTIKGADFSVKLQ